MHSTVYISRTCIKRIEEWFVGTGLDCYKCLKVCSVSIAEQIEGQANAASL